MKKFLVFTTLLATFFIFIVGGAAHAQYSGGRGHGGGGFVYPPHGQGLMTQTLGFQRLSQQATRGAIANDCTDYGYGDCAERAQRQRYGGNNYGYGRGYPMGQPVRPIYPHYATPRIYIPPQGGYGYQWHVERRAVVASQTEYPETICQRNYRKANAPVFNPENGTWEARRWFNIVVPLMGEQNNIGLQDRYPGSSAYIFVGSLNCFVEIDGQYYNEHLFGELSSGNSEQLASANWFVREAAKIQGF